LVEKPPRERPSASLGLSPPDHACPASAGGVLVNAHHTGVHEVQIPVEQTRGIGLGLQGFEHAPPEACLTPR
jgi:hypothetical protein